MQQKREEEMLIVNLNYPHSQNILMPQINKNLKQKDKKMKNLKKAQFINHLNIMMLGFVDY